MGSINKTSKGEYSIRFWYKSKEGLKQKRLTGFKTQKEARLAEAVFLQNNAAPNIIKNCLTLEFLYDEFKRYLINNTKESSYITITSVLDLYVVPYFQKDKDMQSFTAKEALDWKSDINQRGFSYKYKSKIYTSFNSMMIFGCKYLGLGYNAVKEVGAFKNNEIRKEMLFWTKQEFETFIKSFLPVDYVYKVFFSVLYFTGMRRGECLALKWDDIDFENKVIRINKTLSYKSINGGYSETTPKSKSANRNILIPDNLLSMIDKITTSKKSNEYVFGGSNALPIENIRRRFLTYIQKSKVKKIRIHDLRHSHVSLLISQNFDIVTIARRLGHSDIKETLNTYAHMLPSKQESMVQMLENIDIT